MKMIAVVEDDILIGNAIEELLSCAGYGVKRAYSGSEAVMLLEHGTFDLVLLDLNLPGISGEKVLSQVKESVPVIILSAKSAVSDKVRNLIAGASDYITKPFDNDELLARVEVQLRRSSDNVGNVLQWKNIVLDKVTFIVSVDGKALRLTKTEFAILALLMAHPKSVFSKSAIASSIGEFTKDGEESSISVHISSLRHKLGEASSLDYIETVWGIGFKLVP